MSDNIYQGTFVKKGDKMVRLSELSYIFSCPAEGCEYVMTARTKEEADTIESMHYKTAPSTHIVHLQEKNWRRSALSSVTDEADLGEHYARVQFGPGWRS